MRAGIIFLNFVASAAAAAIELSTEPGLGWEGVLVPGEAPVVVWGHSFEDIEATIRKDHPDFSIYTDEDNEDEDLGSEGEDTLVTLEGEEETTTSDDPKAVARRALETRADWGKWNCNAGEWVGEVSVERAMSKLKRINGNRCWAKAKTCQRFVCEGTAGIGICNANSNKIMIACTHIARMAEHVRRKCIDSTYWCSWNPNIGCTVTNVVHKGQAYSPGGTWRTRVGGCPWWGSSGSRAYAAN